MLTNKIRSMYERNTNYCWIIVALSVMTVFFSGPGQTYFISGFIDSFIKEFDISRTEISSYYSTATFIAGILLIFVGRFIDRYGHRRMTMIIASLLGITCILCGNVPSAILLIAVFFLLRLLGQGSMVLLPSTLIPNWFTKRRAMALSLVTLGGVIGSVVIPPINTWALYYFSWRIIWMFWGGLLLVFFVPIVALFLYNEPNSIHKEEGVDKKEQEEISWTLGEALRTKAFWFMVYSQSVPAFVNTGLYFHMYSIMEQKGLSSAIAAMTLSAIGLFSFPATFIAGYVLDRVKVHYVYFITFVFQALGTLLLLFVDNQAIAIVFAFIFGIITGFQNVCRRLVWPEYYGKKHLSSISGLTMTALVIGSSLGPLIIGIGYDYFGSYSTVILVMVLAPVLAALLSILSPKPIKKIK
ncbi:MFS transporter [Vallitalea okinawensis]|uniref:MFS transporter n=1 Tax=Vallitalea okinawensis TaxID=2078660 RepID=UPI000CFC027D|nr:MFS transporter [Vallitalea okinawensis]